MSHVDNIAGLTDDVGRAVLSQLEYHDERPADVPCECGVPLAPHKFPMGWVSRRLCDDCRATRDRNDELARRREQASRAMHLTEVPPRLAGYRVEAMLRRQSTEPVERFRARVRAMDPPTIGVDGYNLAAAKWARGWERAPSSGLLCGPVGTGKTLIVAALAQSMHLRYGSFDYPGARFTSVRRVQSLLKAKHLRTAAEFVRGALTVVDELLTGDVHRWDCEVVEEIVGHCYDQNRHLVITTNGAVADIESTYGARVADRLAEMAGDNRFELDAPSWRVRREA